MSETCPVTHYSDRQGPVPGGHIYYYVKFNGTSSYINCGSDASLDDLPLVGTFTVDFWLAPNLLGISQVIVCKQGVIGFDGWEIYVEPTNNVHCYAQWDFLPSQSRTTQIVTDGTWQHIAIAFNMGVDNFIYVAINGQWCTYITQQAGMFMSPQADAAASLHIGDNGVAGTERLSGSISWLRISSGICYPIGVNFTPPGRCPSPAIDANTIELWAMDEGAGVTTAASVVAANDGAMTDCDWHVCV